jgi:hypothetical protein
MNEYRMVEDDAVPSDEHVREVPLDVEVHVRV